MMAARSALRRLPSRTSKFGSAHAVLQPLAGSAPLLSRALPLPHLPAFRRSSDKVSKDLLDRATNVIKEANSVSNDIVKGVEGLEDLIGRQLDVSSIELSNMMQLQIRTRLQHAVQVPWGHLGVQAFAFVSVASFLAYFGGAHIFNIFTEEVKKITDDAMIEAEKRAIALGDSEWGKETAQLYIDQGFKSVTLRGLVFGPKAQDPKDEKKKTEEAKK